MQWDMGRQRVQLRPRKVVRPLDSTDQHQRKTYQTPDGTRGLARASGGEISGQRQALVHDGKSQDVLQRAELVPDSYKCVCVGRNRRVEVRNGHRCDGPCEQCESLV